MYNETLRHCPHGDHEGLPTEHSAPKSCPILLLQPTWTVSRSSTHAIPRAGRSSERCFYGARPTVSSVLINKYFMLTCAFLRLADEPKKWPIIYFSCNCTVPSRPVTPRFGGLVRKKKRLATEGCGTPSAHRSQQSTPTDKSKGPDQQCRWPQKTPLPFSTVHPLLLFFISYPSSHFR